VPDLGSNGQTGQDKSLELPEAQFRQRTCCSSQYAMSVPTQNVFGSVQSITGKVGHFSAFRPNSWGRRNPQPVDLLKSQLDTFGSSNDGLPKYPVGRNGEIQLALAEAWAWLVAQGLLVNAPGQTGGDFRALSRCARRFENEAEFANYAVSRMVQRDAVHPKIAQTVWMAFMRNEHDVAVFQAMKAVEVAVREVSELPGRLVGVGLVREAFNPTRGPLTDMEAVEGEREALASLFAGAIGTYKNPHSHRDVQLTDPREAVAIIMLANHLLRIVDSRRPG
jgi:uncharacterized protein (TIGR02391 family)